MTAAGDAEIICWLFTVGRRESPRPLQLQSVSHNPGTTTPSIYRAEQLPVPSHQTRAAPAARKSCPPGHNMMLDTAGTRNGTDPIRTNCRGSITNRLGFQDTHPAFQPPQGAGKPATGGRKRPRASHAPPAFPARRRTTATPELAKDSSHNLPVASVSDQPHQHLFTPNH